MSQVPRVTLADTYSVPRIINGAWQLSAGHSSRPIDRPSLFGAWAELIERGCDTFDCADIYRGVEELLGEFRRWRGTNANPIQIHTKFVPDRDALATLDRQYVQRIIDRSLRRLRVERLDLVQFHWWDYSVPGCVEAGLWLAELRRRGKIRNVGATNFDSAHLAELVDAGVPIASHQVQYSLLDRRPASTMSPWCGDRGVSLLCYGTVAGGFLSERWLGRPEPKPPLENRSLVKYRLTIDEFGGWDRFQQLLRTLRTIAAKHRVEIGTVALRFVLDRPAVAACIVGGGGHTAATIAACALELDAEDREQISAVIDTAPGPSGEVYGLERIAGGRHAAIMRDDLNREG